MHEKNFGIIPVFEALDCARWAPCIEEEAPWEFVLVKEPERVKKALEILETERKGDNFLIFVLADIERLKFLNKKVESIDLETLAAFYTGEAVEAIVAALRDQGFSYRLFFIERARRKAVQEFVKAPATFIPLAALSVGYAKSYRELRRPPLKAIIHVEFVGNEWQGALPEKYRKKTSFDIFQKIFI